MIKERRKHPRLRIPLEAEYLVAGEDEWREGTIWTLGAGGAALLCETPLERGTVLAGLHFVVAAQGDLPETRIEVGADVVSSELQDDVGRSGNFMLGLQFRDLGEQEFELLRQFVFRRLTGSPRSPAQDESEPQAVGTMPIEIRFKLFDEFVEEVSESLSPRGMFIRAHRPLPPGSRFVFQFQLGEDFSLFQGTAEVVWTRRRSEVPDRPPGMGVRFLKLDLTSQKLLRRLVGQRASEADVGETAEEPLAETAVEPVTEVDSLVMEPGPPESPAPPSAGVAPEVESPASGAEVPEMQAAAEAVAHSDGRLEERLRQAAAARDAADERLTRLTEDLVRRREEWERLEVELRAQLGQRIASEAEFQERAERAAETEAELRQRLEQAESGRDELKQRLERAERGRDELEPRLERLDETESELERVRLESARAASAWDAAKTELRAQLVEKGSGEVELQQRLERSGEVEVELRERLDRREAEGAELEARVEQAESLEDELASLRLETVESARAWQATETALRARLEQGSAARAELEQRQADADDIEAELRQRLREVGGERDELAQRVNQGAVVEAALREQAQELRAGCADLETELGRARERMDAMRGVAEEMKSRLNGDLSAAQALETDLADKLAEVAEVGSSLEQKVQSVSAARADLGRRLARISGVWSSLEDGLAELELEADRQVESDEDDELPPAVQEPDSETERLDAAPIAAPVEQEQEPAVASEAASEEPGTAAREEPPGDEVAAESSEPPPASLSGAQRLVGAARRAAARFGLARTAPANGNGASPEPVPAAAAEPEAEADAETSGGAAGPVAIEETVKAWAAAWSEQRVDDYLSFYSRQFEPVATAGDGDASEAPHAWLPPFAGMELTLGPISQTELEPGRFAVRFEQCVESDSYSRRTGRTLEMVREADAWKIAAESFQEL